MDYVGYNGTVAIVGDTLVITHHGAAAKMGGLERDKPRRIPLQALSGLSAKEPTRLVNGYVTFGLGGADAPALGSGRIASHGDTVMFRWKDKPAFDSLRQYLQSVLDYNRQNGVDSSAFAFEPAPSGRADIDTAETARETTAVQEGSLPDGFDAEEAPAESAPKTYGRPDIDAAASRMNWKMGGRRELKFLKDHLIGSEVVKFIVQGTYEDDQGILVLTDQRLLFLFHGLIRQRKEDFPMRSISSVQTKSGLGTGDLKVFASGNTAVIRSVIKRDLEPIASAIREAISSQASVSTPPQLQDSPRTDPVEALKQLAALREAGILSEEEFAAKKAEILRRL